MHLRAFVLTVAARLAVALVLTSPAPALASDAVASSTVSAAAPRAAPVAALPKDLESELARMVDQKWLSKMQLGLQVVDLQSGAAVFERNADTLLGPASTNKVVTAAAALKTLGPSWRFRTAVTSDARPDAGGVVKGNVYVRGSGDPTLVVEKLWKLVADMELAGVKSIQGDLVFDDTAFTADTSLAGWDKAADIERGPAYFPALSALSVNFNTTAIVVRPGPKAGEPAVVRLETPAGAYVEVESKVTTGPSGGRRGVQVERIVRPDGGMKFVVTGAVPVDDEASRYYRTIADPTGHFAAIFAELVRARGITWSGTLRRGPSPDAPEVLAEVESPALAAVLMDMNKLSSNYSAELVLRALGAASGELQGSTETGLAVVRDYLVGLGLDDQDFVLVNGSGLSREARLTPAALNAVMIDMQRDPRVGPEFAASLALAGWDGTLSGRLEDVPGLLRGKTGTIGGVHGLTGYIASPDGHRYAFSFLVNGVDDTGPIRQLHDRFARALLEGSDTSVADAP